MPSVPNVASLPNPRALRTAPWWVKTWTNNDRAELSEDKTVLTTTLVPRRWGVDSGTALYSVPLPAPAASMMLRFEVFVDDDFDWARGGLFGWGVMLDAETPSAVPLDQWAEVSGGVQCMWDSTGCVGAYVHLPLEGSDQYTVIRSQSFAFEKAASVVPGSNGVALLGTQPLRKGWWNSVELSVTLNTVGKFDGALALKTNHQTVQDLREIAYRRRNETIRIRGTSFQAHMRGVEHTIVEPQHLQFRDVRLYYS